MQVLTDWKLIVIVFVIVGVAVFLLLVGEAVPYLRGAVVLVEDAEDPKGRNVRFMHAHAYTIVLCYNSTCK